MNTRHHTAVNGSQYQDKATYASPYCPGYADTSDPYFAAQAMLDKAALLAAIAAVALAAWTVYMFAFA